VGSGRRLPLSCTCPSPEASQDLLTLSRRSPPLTTHSLCVSPQVYAQKPMKLHFASPNRNRRQPLLNVPLLLILALTLPHHVSSRANASPTRPSRSLRGTSDLKHTRALQEEGAQGQPSLSDAAKPLSGVGSDGLDVSFFDDGNVLPDSVIGFNKPLSGVEATGGAAAFTESEGQEDTLIPAQNELAITSFAVAKPLSGLPSTGGNAGYHETNFQVLPSDETLAPEGQTEKPLSGVEANGDAAPIQNDGDISNTLPSSQRLDRDVGKPLSGVGRGGGPAGLYETGPAQPELVTSSSKALSGVGADGVNVNFYDDGNILPDSLIGFNKAADAGEAASGESEEKQDALTSAVSNVIASDRVVVKPQSGKALSGVGADGVNVNFYDDGNILPDSLVGFNKAADAGEAASGESEEKQDALTSAVSNAIVSDRAVAKPSSAALWRDGNHISSQSIMQDGFGSDFKEPATETSDAGTLPPDSDASQLRVDGADGRDGKALSGLNADGTTLTYTDGESGGSLQDINDNGS
jgi:hypothetical protein